jgi:hypothetical protein
VAVDSADPRMRAAELTESEFLGTLEVHCDNDAYELLDIFTEMEPNPWVSLPDRFLLEPREGYRLRYAAGIRVRPGGVSSIRRSMIWNQSARFDGSRKQPHLKYARSWTFLTIGSRMLRYCRWQPQY